MVTDDRSRGQIILIGAIALAFIILGVVVVFNGVLYTETLSSGSSSQSASTADVTSTEVNQSVGCLLEIVDKDLEDGEEEKVKANITDLSREYRQSNARSTPTVKNISVTGAPDEAIDFAGDDIQRANVTITYDSHDLSYNRTQEIQPNCPSP